jgi:hypothetical protein
MLLVLWIQKMSYAAATSCQTSQKENDMRMGPAYLVVPRTLMIISNIMLAGVLGFCTADDSDADT